MEQIFILSVSTYTDTDTEINIYIVNVHMYIETQVTHTQQLNKCIDCKCEKMIIFELFYNWS